ADDGIRDFHVTGVQTCALPILGTPGSECDFHQTCLSEPGHRLEQADSGLTLLTDPDDALAALQHVLAQRRRDLPRAPLPAACQRSEERRVGEACRPTARRAHGE